MSRQRLLELAGVITEQSNKPQHHIVVIIINEELGGTYNDGVGVVYLFIDNKLHDDWSFGHNPEIGGWESGHLHVLRSLEKLGYIGREDTISFDLNDKEDKEYLINNKLVSGNALDLEFHDGREMEQAIIKMKYIQKPGGKKFYLG